MSTPSSSDERKPSFRRAFMPFWIALVFSAIALLFIYHARHRVLTRLAMHVTVEGAEMEEPFLVQIDGQTQRLDSAVPMGSQRIVISARDCEPIVRNHFVWYGVTDLGAVDLVRSRGAIEAVVLPTPDAFELTGNGLRLTNSTGSFPGVIVGRYRLTCRFGDLEERVEAVVTRNQTTPVAWAANVGGLELSADPTEGEFNLVPEGGRGGFRGTFPATIRRLASGDYRLTAKRPGYERALKVQVRPNETNRFVVKFAYGNAQISTKPEGATVLWAGVERGKTPLTLTNLVPGNYRMELRLAGFDTAGGSVVVEPDATAMATHAFVNTRYRESMESARRQLDQGDFERALQSLDAALEAQPGDPVASGLRPGTKARLFRSRATLLAGQGDYEGAQRTLESALRDSPDDKETIELRDALRLKQTQEAKAQFEARVQNVIGQARAAAGRRDFDKAVEYLEEAERLSPADATIGQLQAEIAVERLRNLTPAEAKKQDEDLIEHANQFRTVWAQALRENGSTEVFLTKYWESTKTVRDIRKALQEMGAKTSTFQVSNLSTGSRFYFTAKVGSLKPPIQDGFYFVVGVLARAGGKVDISAKVYAYNPVAGSPVAETNKEVLQERLERLRSRLSEELGTPIY